MYSPSTVKGVKSSRVRVPGGIFIIYYVGSRVRSRDDRPGPETSPEGPPRVDVVGPSLPAPRVGGVEWTTSGEPGTHSETKVWGSDDTRLPQTLARVEEVK